MFPVEIYFNIFFFINEFKEIRLACKLFANISQERDFWLTKFSLSSLPLLHEGKDFPSWYLIYKKSLISRKEVYLLNKILSVVKVKRTVCITSNLNLDILSPYILTCSIMSEEDLLLFFERNLSLTHTSILPSLKKWEYPVYLSHLVDNKEKGASYTTEFLLTKREDKFFYLITQREEVYEDLWMIDTLFQKEINKEDLDTLLFKLSYFNRLEITEDLLFLANFTPKNY